MARKHAIAIVAHPDDETLWAGGYIFDTPELDWFILCLSRANDPDRAPKFHQVLRVYGALGMMADIDDGPDQLPVDEPELRKAILLMTPERNYDLVLTHGPRGEYTRHIRHEEVSQAVRGLWLSGELQIKSLWMFAYQDNNRAILPKPEETAHRFFHLPDEVWRKKYEIMTGVYGFAPESWEARTTPRTEAFWCFDSPEKLLRWEGVDEPLE